jgi:hypothetical protein
MIRDAAAFPCCLAVAGTGVSAATIDLFQNDRSFGETQATAAVFFGNQGSQPSGLGECLDDSSGYASFVILHAKILRREICA